MIGALRALLAPSGLPSLPASLALPGGDLPLEVRVNRRARRMTLRVCAATRRVRLTVPPRVGTAAARAFVDAHRGWIAAQAARRLPPAVPFAPGVALPVGGELLRLTAAGGRIARRDGDALLVPGDGTLFAGRVRRWLQAEAQRVLAADTQRTAMLVGREVREVRVGDFRSRWGSCAADARIAYSWRLILAPVHVREAVVAHEVAHLVEPNHGPRFWKTATVLLGRPHDEARAWLCTHGPSLLAYGAD